MIISRYPNIKIQETEHKALIKTVQQKSIGLREGVVNGNDIMKYLLNWFMQHTQVEDRKFAEYIHEQTMSRTTSDSDEK
jgi:hemerythrin